MDPQGQFIATLIEASGKALAAGAITRLSEAGHADDVEAWGFQQLVADAQVRLENLAEALAVGRPDLLQLEVQWLATTYVARQVPLDFLRRTLECLRAELAEGLPAVAATMACSYLDSARENLAAPLPELPSLLVDGQPHVDLARSFLLTALEGRRNDAQRLLSEAFEGGVSVPDLHQHVLTRVQAEMGRMWQVGDVDVAEEHLGSRIVEEALILLRDRMPRVEENGRSVLVAAVRGTLHDIGARMVADHFEMAGWRSFFLGADTPTDDIVAAIKHFDVDLVALSAGLGLNIRATAELVAAIRASHAAVPVLVGGRPFSQLPDLWQNVGADGSATDSAGAVLEGDRLIERRSATPQ
jgi:methanogenic corrinoid protein MtbC1